MKTAKQVSTVEALEVMDLTELQQVVYYEARNSGACHDDALDATVGI